MRTADRTTGNFHVDAVFRSLGFAFLFAFASQSALSVHGLCLGCVSAQEPGAEELSAAGPAAADAAASPGLTDKQAQVIERYRRLEEVLLRLADVEADENPERAALLRRAARQSRDTFVLEKMIAASDSLKLEQFAKALESQGAAKDGLEKLLTLLLSEDRPQRIRDEKKRIANMIKELKVVERQQRSTRARTENGADLDDVAQEQSQITERSEKVSGQLKEEEPTDGASESPKESSETPGQSDESKPMPTEGPKPDNDAKDKDASTEDPAAKPTEDPAAKPEEQPDGSDPAEKPTESSAGKPSEQKDAPKDSPSSESSEAPMTPPPASESEESPSQPSESKPAGEQAPAQQPPSSQSQAESPSSEPQPPPAPQSPEQEAQSKLDNAIKEMQQAEQELDEAKRDKAIEKQKKAEENLRAAIDRLEKILRQLREEEMQRELARLESRLRKMAQMQVKVLDDTKALVAIPEPQRDRQVDLKAGNLAFDEKKIVLEADRAMLLLREEGTSVAFPEVMAQIRGDMQKVAERLAATKLDAVTTGIQDDVLAGLEEMIAALQQAQRDLEKKKQEQQQSGGQNGGQQGEQPLVEQIAELKLIRTMETRIKTTTERYAGIIDERPDGAGDVIPLLKDLSQRQSDLYRVTRDLVLKRNQ